MFKNISLLLPRFRFANQVQKTSTKQTQASGLTFYKDGQLTTRQQIVLKKTQDIESFVIKTIQNYYRSTYKQGLTKESKLSDHGLDSLDSIQIAMQIQQDLGYVISAETLPQFHKVKHFINYIEQVQAFKKENNKNPLP